MKSISRPHHHGQTIPHPKIAASIDGKTALSNGESKWITSVASRRDVHAMRRDSCAILTGIGTVMTDNPTLSVRDVECVRQPLRIVLDNQLSITDDKAILAGGNTLVMTTTNNQARITALAARGVEVILVEPELNSGKIDLNAMMLVLAHKKINSIMVETGAKLNAALIAADVVDELVFYIAPSILGDNAKGLFALPALANLRDRINLHFTDVRQIGADIKITASILKNS
ncbi:MAG: bifunctional diaminohydroxyphosphoribosylaminopyrimidine deaminase/5-amino-6-(5-phosphoribosylamino)uracil reductase RibD [Gammaproteobacteria bacterium]|nr:bifunctional diaminohydroxyphosphoribosylaminopyrimidine deaminase/5-amino-6-(5-phosphoribosylamino)uracil reductase RibD [Gammaproteobacteria bacterium]